MAYTPKEWETGDIITTTDLNNIEAGIENANAEIITTTYESVEGHGVVTLNKTWKEINDNFGDKLFFVYIDAIPEYDFGKGVNLLSYIIENNGTYIVSAGSVEFTTDSETGYPVWEMN